MLNDFGSDDDVKRVVRKRKGAIWVHAGEFCARKPGGSFSYSILGKIHPAGGRVEPQPFYQLRQDDPFAAAVFENLCVRRDMAREPRDSSGEGRFILGLVGRGGVKSVVLLVVRF